MSAKRSKSLGIVRKFNEAFKIGTKVKLRGDTHKTWGHAGLSFRDEAVVFLEKILEPVIIADLEIEGWKPGK